MERPSFGNANAGSGLVEKARIQGRCDYGSDAFYEDVGAPRNRSRSAGDDPIQATKASIEE